ncbi:MAG: catalase [Actinocatenispora sp.]
MVEQDRPRTDEPIGDDDFDKDRALGPARRDPSGNYLTTDQGVRVDQTDNSLSVGERGPTLLEDFHAREKITRFDHERIPERVVHARGAGAYGYFQPYESWAEYTVADFLQDPARRTPVFVRFSTVAGSRGSADTVRDVRGFATKFYTRAGNYDLVGNNMPVFFIQDGIKFPDFVHAVKPEPHNEMPQGASAHDTFWDFVSLQPEAMHMVMWLMSDRALPRSYRMMQGFGVHTFRFVDAAGRGTFVKFHWRPALGTHSLTWDEAQRAAGKDPDFNRRDLWESIESGQFPEYELGVQLVPESDEFAFDVDLLDATKLLTEEQVPVRPVGRMVLDRNPDNFFAETEQVAFHTANVVPGIDFTNDPLLQMRNFSYLDTQLIRLGGPNFAQLPVNRPVARVSNNQRDGYGQQMLHQGQASYTPNSLNPGGCPVVAGGDHGAFVHHTEKVEGHTIRRRSGSFKDFYGQATLFWNSMADWERDHIVAAFLFELGKVEHRHVRERTVERLNQIDHELAVTVATGIGVAAPGQEAVANHGRRSPALSQVNLAGEQPDAITSRKIAVLAAPGVNAESLRPVLAALTERGAVPEVLGPRDGPLDTVGGSTLEVRRAHTTVASVLYDAVLVPDGPDAAASLAADGEAAHYVLEAFKHGKAVGGLGTGAELVGRLLGAAVTPAGDPVAEDRGVVLLAASDNGSARDQFVTRFAVAVAAHRHWDRAVGRVSA